MPWIVAFFVFVAALCGIALIAVSDAGDVQDRALTAALTVQLPPDTSDARVQTIAGLLRQTRGITEIRPLDAKETAQLLEPWLGPSPPVAELPVPRLIDAKVAPDADPDLAALRQQLNSVLPEARLVDHRSLLNDMHGERRGAEAVFSTVILLATLLIAITAMYACDNALLVEHEIVQLVHLLGADDATIARQFTTRACLISGLGGLIGIAAALGAELVLRRSPASLAITLPVGDWRMWAVLAAAIVISVVAALASAQISIRRRLALLP